MPIILKAGSPKQDRTTRVTCQQCGCIFECKRKELEAHDDRNETIYCIKCPQEGCGSVCWLSGEALCVRQD